MKSKKELKEAYRQMSFRMGVFCLRNKKDNRIWIHHSMDLDRAWNSVRLQLQSDRHPNTALQEDWNRLGEENFACEIIEELKDTQDPAVDYKKEVLELYKLCLEELQPYHDKGYHRQKS
ncbi:GIY-YIG nuclease family protein [Chitinophaga oryzae]|uniref:GIY-YIG nuclease family protein n=1 Tax=Chitinophaga oryzae TaxID=2725414 RepID=A0ABX6LCF5_9BACT|nr:GIY-YIG nuclease family protein [Chitinophaga oryzae]QJB37456.1 GIY-YIG nuclease family protein [Chitinophaga oryzae]